MKQKIIDGLLKLNVENDNHWTADGLPKIEALKFTVGPSVTREDVNAVAPNFTRSNPVIEEETTSVEEKEIEVDTDNSQYESLSKEKHKVTEMTMNINVTLSDALKSLLKELPEVDFETTSLEELVEIEKQLIDSINADREFLCAVDKYMERKSRLRESITNEIEQRKPKQHLADALRTFREQMKDLPHVVNLPRTVVRNGIRTR